MGPNEVAPTDPGKDMHYKQFKPIQKKFMKEKDA